MPIVDDHIQWRIQATIYYGALVSESHLPLFFKLIIKSRQHLTVHQFPTTTMGLMEQFPAMDLYQVLGVPHDASKDSIKKAFRKLSLATHPDKTRNNTEMKDRCVDIIKAYKILSDDNKRSQYNVFMLFGGICSGPPSSGGQQSGSTSKSHRHNTDNKTPQGDKPSSPSSRPKGEPQASSGKKGDDNNNNSDKTKTKTDNRTVFDLFKGGYKSFRLKFEKQKQKQREEEETEKSPAAESPKEEEGKNDLPPELIYAYLERQLGSLEEKLDCLVHQLVTISRRLKVFILRGDIMSPLGNSLSTARKRIRHLQRSRDNLEDSLERARASKETSEHTYFGLAHSVDRLLARVTCAQRAIDSIDDDAWDILKATPSLREILIEDMRKYVTNWLQHAKRKDSTTE